MNFFKSILYDLKFLVKYKGFKFQCPFCNKWYRQFYSGGNKGDCFDKHIIIGSGYRKNVFCPNCGSKDRERLVYLYLKNKISIQTQDLKVLHVAPELNLRDYLIIKKNIIQSYKFLVNYLDLSKRVTHFKEHSTIKKGSRNYSAGYIKYL